MRRTGDRPSNAHADESQGGRAAGPLAMIVLLAVAVGVLSRERPALATIDRGGGDPAGLAAVDGGEARSAEPGTAWALPDEPALGFVEIPGGPFPMGSDPARDPLAYDVEVWSTDQPVGVVDLPTFYIGRYEVTVAQYDAFLRETGRDTAPGGDRRSDRGTGVSSSIGPDHPVSSVSWPDALAYATWLDARLRSWPELPDELSDLLQSGGRVTLPTEAQWEKAARSTDGRVYPWGDEFDPGLARVGAAAPEPVGSRACPDCAYGLADMAGNVWEWTRSPYQPYPYSDVDDQQGMDADALWVMRGGSFADDVRNARAAGRGGADPGARRPFIGFRLVISRD